MTCVELRRKFVSGLTAEDAEIAEENESTLRLLRSPRSICQLQLKVMRSDIHAPVQVKAVRSESLHTRIEGEVLASLLLLMFDEPIEKRGAKSARAVGIVRDEIVDVNSAAGEKEIQDAKARHGADDTVQLQKRKLVPSFCWCSTRAAKSMALMWGRSSRMTEQQWPICSGVFARLILHAATFAADMTFHRSRRAEIKRGIETKAAW
jgi:hypothetical protein